MAASDFYSNQRRAAELGREHQKLTELVGLHAKLKQTAEAIAEHEALLADPASDADLRTLVAEELVTLRADLPKLHEQVMLAMLPPDPSDARNTIVEIRAGTGGDEASLFAAEMARLYTRYAEVRGWTVEPLDSSPSEAGGYKDIVFLISGDDVYRTLKWESGVHRVQRVPATEANGRIHTSTVTVAVLPEAQEVDVEIRPDELEITVARASGPGGQGVNTTDSAVQIIHKPTGLIVKCADERSQLKNKAKALKVLRARLLERKQDEEAAKYSAQRKAQVGTGDRSERIRTYNFPQSRVTDHRIGFTAHNLTQLMEGEISELLTALTDAEKAEKLKTLNDKAEEKN
ncbi:MAG TPA: peptide chain release factor 1 [Opitutales bacterium]|nr:peptide chain release factor 1 [Opitutales bacterium]